MESCWVTLFCLSLVVFDAQDKEMKMKTGILAHYRVRSLKIIHVARRRLNQQRISVNGRGTQSLENARERALSSL